MGGERFRAGSRAPPAASPQREPTYAQVDVVEDFLDGAVLPDEVDGPFGADPLDGAAVVAAEQNAKVYELGGQKGRECMQRMERGILEAALSEGNTVLVRL